MTIEELRKELEKIPSTGAINKAIRQSILAQIYALMEKGEQ